MPGETFDVAKAVETITSPPSPQACAAAKELYQYLSENPPVAAPVTSKLVCALVTDSGDAVMEILATFVPQHLQSRTITRPYDRLSDAVNLFRESPPALLVIHSNLILTSSGIEEISALVAVSPGTRYLVVTGWTDIDIFRKVSDDLRVRIDVMQMPCSRGDFAAAVEAALPAGSDHS
jgi:hypothetical protein